MRRGLQTGDHPVLSPDAAVGHNVMEAVGDEEAAYGKIVLEM